MAQKNNNKTNREYRNVMVPFEVREAGEGEMIVAGYACTFNEPYELYSWDDVTVREQIAPDAFNDADMSDVIMQYNHEGRVFARNSNDTLTVTPDEKGLYIEADLSGTELGRQLYEEIRGGYTNKMSFGFTVEADEETRTEEDGRVDYLRTITKIRKLYDVSAVSIPANDATSISVRKLTDGVIEKLQAERLAAEELETERRRLKVKARALGGI